MSEPAPVIVFALFPGVTQLDFTGPHEVFSSLPGDKRHHGEHGGRHDRGYRRDDLCWSRRLAEIPKCDVVCVPGGRGSIDSVIHDEVFLSELRRLAATARYITSVCTGSLVLGAAGLLQGKRATSHWAWRDMLSLFGAIPDPGRVITDGNVITGGGVTAGIDFALSVVAELTDPETAQAIQLQIEYAPLPPFNAGRPETAPPAILARVRERNETFAASRRGRLEEAAARLAAS